MKILHITYHSGCHQAINYVAKNLGFDIETQWADWNYNIGHSRAEEIWNKYKDYYNQFDIIITSDTGPLSRILLQNHYSGKLIIWVCNRFDYSDAATFDCEFPDQEYYDLFRTATKSKNVKVFSYTKFEHEYAQKYHNIQWSNIIKPPSFVEPYDLKSEFSENIDKSKMFFIPPYHNDTVCVDLKAKCDSLGISAFNGKYGGPLDLENIKGIIHIPYAWSNLALFENWYLGNVYLIPTTRFLFQLQTEGHFFWSPPFPPQYVKSSEWYLPEYEHLFCYFDGWQQLKMITSDDNLLQNKKQQILQFSRNHNEKVLQQWKSAFQDWQ